MTAGALVSPVPSNGPLKDFSHGQHHTRTTLHGLDRNSDAFRWSLEYPRSFVYIQWHLLFFAIACTNTWTMTRHRGAPCDRSQHGVSHAQESIQHPENRRILHVYNTVGQEHRRSKEETHEKRWLRKRQAAGRLQKCSVNFVAHVLRRLHRVKQAANSRRHIRNDA